ncbi:putative RNA methyltransferase [Nonomuraea sp. NPDC048916]|uniref:putative RNA methyltransferase n=1 Tax=Nonomuraea sp. NPDC048916 TaxID=3154232 RepID=UPI0033C5CCCB
MLGDIVDLLACPVCHGELTLEEGALRCAHGHAFDVARQGYVSLLVGSRAPGTADSAEMVAARAGFLGAGHYAPLTEALARSVAMRIPGSQSAPAVGNRTESFPKPPDGATAKAYGGAGHGAAQEAGHTPVIVDAGAGTGHYLAAVLEGIGGGIGVAFDVSKHAVRRAARAHPRVGAFVADVWRPLPIRSGVADVVMNVFAPRNGPEFRRILRPGGVVVVVTPAPAHLSPLVRELGLLSVDEEKERRVARSLEGFVEAERQTIEFDLHLARDDIAEVVRMGPSAWHTEASELEKQISGYISRRVAKNREKAVVRAAFHLSIFEASPRSSIAP